MKEALGALRAGGCSAGALLFLAVLDCSAVATSAADFSTDVVLLLLAGLGCSTGVAFTADFFADVTLLLVSHLVQKHKNNCSRCSQMLGRGGRRSGGYAN